MQVHVTEKGNYLRFTIYKHHNYDTKLIKEIFFSELGINFDHIVQKVSQSENYLFYVNGVVMSIIMLLFFEDARSVT